MVLSSERRAVERVGHSQTAMTDEQLRSAWRAHDGKLALGAFSAVRLSDIEQWRSRGQLIERSDCAAVVRIARRDELIDDFREQPVVALRRGDVHVQRMMMLAGADQSLHELLVELTAGKRALVSCWQEHERERSIVDRLGLHFVGSKIKSTSEIIGLWARMCSCPYSALDEVGIAALNLTYDVEALQHDLEALQHDWSNHYSTYNRKDSWQALALRGYGGDASFIVKPAEMTAKWRAANAELLSLRVSDTPLLDAMPSVQGLLEDLGMRTQRVRLMRLSPVGASLCVTLIAATLSAALTTIRLCDCTSRSRRISTFASRRGQCTASESRRT